MSVLGKFINNVSYVFRRIRRSFYQFFLLEQFKCYGKNVSILGNVTIINPANMVVGSDVSINHNVYINAFNPISIGDDVTISANAVIVSTGIDYIKWFDTHKKVHIDDKTVVIGDHVWVGAGAYILAGVRITGEYVVVAANAVVTQDITENYCVVAGCPARIVKRFNTKD